MLYVTSEWFIHYTKMLHQNEIKVFVGYMCGYLLSLKLFSLSFVYIPSLCLVFKDLYFRTSVAGSLGKSAKQSGA